MVVYIVGWHQRHHITAAQGPLVRKAQFGAATGMADHVPMLVSLHPRTGDRELTRGVVSHHSGRWTHRRGPSGVASRCTPGDAAALPISGVKL